MAEAAALRRQIDDLDQIARLQRLEIEEHAAVEKILRRQLGRARWSTIGVVVAAASAAVVLR